MAISYGPPILFGLLIELMVMASLYIVNAYLKVSPSIFASAAWMMGTLTVSLASIYYVASKLTPVKTTLFYLAFLPLFLLSCLDVNIAVGLWIKPHHWIMTEYLKLDDKLLHSVWGANTAFMDGTILHILYFIAIIRMFNGLSWRSLLLFNGTCETGLFVIFFPILAVCRSWAGIHPMILGYIVPAPFYLLMVIMTWNSKRNFTFKRAQASNYLDLLAAAGLILSIVIMLEKFLVIQMNSSWLIDWSRSNDPMLLFNEDLKSLMIYSVGEIQAFLYVLVIVPTLALNLYYKLQSTKPAFLWDLTVFQLGVVVNFQWYFIMGAFYWGTSPDHKASFDNVRFWLLNGLPVLSSGLELLSWYQYRVNADQANAQDESTPLQPSKSRKQK